MEGPFQLSWLSPAKLDVLLGVAGRSAAWKTPGRGSPESCMVCRLARLFTSRRRRLFNVIEI
jgi:hypothetical protein